MAEGPVEQVDLEGGERVLRLWPVETTRPDGSADRAAWLVLTNHRASCFRRAGLFGPGRLEKPPLFERRLEQVRSVTVERFWMKIGYGDRLEVPGLAIDGHGFRLNRETSSAEVRTEVERARQARRSELGLPLA